MKSRFLTPLSFLLISLICITALSRYFNQVLHVDFPPDQTWHCTLVIVVMFTSVMCSTLFIMSMTFDRFYSIIRPHKAASFNTIKRAKITISCIVMFAIIFNIPHFYLSLSEGRSCIPNGKGRESAHGQFYYWLSFVFTFAFPFVALLIMNCVIIDTLRNRSRNTLTNDKSQGQNKVKIKTSERQVYIILLLVTFRFLILSSPSYVFMLYSMLYNYRKSPYSFAGFYLYYNVAQKLHYTNSGINFFLYVISGQKFRADLIKLFRCVKQNEHSQNASCGSTVTELH